MSKTALTSSLEKPVLILNPGGQYAKRLDTKVREMGYATDFIPMSWCKLTIQQIHDRYSAVMIAWSGSSVNDKSAPKLPFNIKNIQIPVLGICYGAQRINKDSGWKVESVWVREDGPDDVRVDTQSPLCLTRHYPKSTSYTWWFTHSSCSWIRTNCDIIKGYCCGHR